MKFYKIAYHNNKKYRKNRVDLFHNITEREIKAAMTWILAEGEKNMVDSHFSHPNIHEFNQVIVFPACQIIT